jgi:hypothetical protein
MWRFLSADAGEICALFRDAEAVAEASPDDEMRRRQDG